ncbi:MAG: phytanoyl-CoA dioxygenase family protein [Saccharothrix sp.]|nr:phytanoyl-CoA dioxygenase family protein [Saccharothrix sp.]
MRLDPAELRHYSEQGYCLPPGRLFAPEKLARLTAICHEHIAARGTRAADDLDKPHFDDERLLEFLLADEVLDLVEPICGPDIVLGSSHLVAKEPGVSRATPWHEDTAYLRFSNTLTDYTQMVSVWLSINGSTERNGCMRVLPGSHLQSDSSDYVDVPDPTTVSFTREIRDVDETAAVSFVLEPGQVSLHDGRIVHSSFPNESADFRIGFVARYFPATVGVNPERMVNHRLWLARGRDHGMNEYVDHAPL